MTIKLRKISTIPIARAPIVLNGPVLTMTSVVTGNASKFVVRLDKHTYKEIWRKAKPARVRRAYGDKVLVYSAGEMQLWDESGEVLWKRAGNAATFEDVLVFHIEAQLQRVDARTGETLDEFECEAGVPLLLHQDILLLVDPSGTTNEVRAINLRTGALVWQKNLADALKPAYHDTCPRGFAFVTSCPEQFVASSGQHVVCFSLLDATLRWGLRMDIKYLMPQAKDGRIYVWTTEGAASSTTTVTLNIDTGRGSLNRSIPAARQSRFVIMDEATGEILTDRPLTPYGEPFHRFQESQGGTVCENHIVFTTTSGLMAAFRLSDGELVSAYQHRDELFQPVFEENRLYVPCADGTLVVFEAEGGDL